MMLIEQTAVPEAALPVEAFRAHLRLGTGFADDAVQDEVIARYLRAAISAVEGRIEKALLARRFVWRVSGWRHADRQALPVAPVAQILSLALIDRAGEARTIEAETYRLERDAHRPHLVAASGGGLPRIPLGGQAELAFEAGFGPDWAAVPADLAQAVFLLAANYHEHRHEARGGDVAMPFGVAGLIERWRTVRLLGGRAT